MSDNVNKPRHYIDLKKAEFYLKRLIEELEYGSRK